MESLNNEKPRLIQTGAGFSILNTVEYKNRFLYSKYNPSRAILSVIQNIEILKGSIIVICSPALWYGLPELLEKLPEDCIIFAAEVDAELFKLAVDSLDKKFNKLIKLYSFDNLLELDSEIRNAVETGQYRRVLRLDFSAGTQFYPEKYNYLINGIQEIISVYWKNRITLQKFGRLFSKNIFRNLFLLKNNRQLSDVKHSVAKPIIVCGAGESLDQFTWKFNSNDFYIISVDAAVNSLCKKNIVPDAIVGLEGQFAIQSSYIGLKKHFKQKEPVFFADLCSRNEVTDLFKNKVFFLSDFASTKYIKNLSETNIIKDIIPPMGSVGLAAVYIALQLRKDNSIPVFTVGLDFCYSAGKTHCKETNAFIRQISLQNKFNSAENYGACFSESAIFTTDKNNITCFTTPALLSYANQFINQFSQEENLFDAGKFGLNLKTKSFSFDKIANSISFSTESQNECNQNFDSSEISKKINTYINQQKKELSESLSLLQEGENSPYRNKAISLDEQLKINLEAKDYLYLHFPDGQKYSPETNFLKRIRAEISFFLKQIEIIEKQ